MNTKKPKTTQTAKMSPISQQRQQEAEAGAQALAERRAAAGQVPDRGVDDRALQHGVGDDASEPGGDEIAIETARRAVHQPAGRPTTSPRSRSAAS